MKILVALKSDKVGLLSLGIRSRVVVPMGGLKHNCKFFVTSSIEKFKYVQIPLNLNISFLLGLKEYSKSDTL